MMFLKFSLKTTLLTGIMILLFSSLSDAQTLPVTYNVVWNSQSKNASESMPLVGGDMGCNVWVESGDILFYMQRSGSFDENGEYLKMGRFRIQLTPNPFFFGNIFRQELKLEDGYIEIESGKDNGKKVLIKLWIDVFRSVLHVDVESEEAVDVSIAYESWRYKDKELVFGKGRFGAFGLEGYPGKVIRTKDNITHNDNGILFYHRNPAEKLIPEVYIELQELEDYADEIYDDIKNRTFGGLVYGDGFLEDGTTEGSYQNTLYKGWKLRSESAKKKHHLLVATHIEQSITQAKWQEGLHKTVELSVKDKQKAFYKTVKWWNDFWQRSHIFIQLEKLDPKDPVWQMSRNYQLFRYQLGGNAYGEYPTKFNGGNLVYDSGLVDKKKAHDPDWRQWGGAVFTAQNQRLLYWPMLKSGDFDAIIPQFDLYRKGLPGARARVKKHFGHAGAVYCEYTNAPGLAFGDGWGWQNDNNYRIRGEEIPFGDDRATAATAFNDPVEKGVMANGSIAYHWESQIEHAYMVMEYHRFTSADISMYIPFIEQSLVFFDEHYRLRQKMRNGKELDENNKLLIYPSTSCESYRGAKNPTDVLSGLQACIKSVLQLDDKYIPEKRKEYYRGFLSCIPDYSYEKVDGLEVIKPAESWLRESNQELPQFYPLFPFDQFKLGDEEIQLFKNAYTVAPAFRKGTIQSWHQDGIQFARMGMAEEAMDYNIRIMNQRLL